MHNLHVLGHFFTVCKLIIHMHDIIGATNIQFQEQIEVILAIKILLISLVLKFAFNNFLTLIPPYFVLKLSSAFTSAVYIQVHLKLDFIMEASTMNPDQTALKGAV